MEKIFLSIILAISTKEVLAFFFCWKLDGDLWHRFPGIIYWLGTNGCTVNDWVNPATVGIVHITTSDGSLPYGRPEDILSRDINALNCHSSDDKFVCDL